MEITYDQGSDFIGHEVIKCLIETEYRITANPITSVNPTSIVILEWICQVLGNLLWTFNIIQTYINEYYPCTSILDAADFAIFAQQIG